MVERSIAWPTRGNRKLRYRGVAENHAWLHPRVAAITLRRLLAPGVTAHHGAGTPARRRGPARVSTRGPPQATVTPGQGDLLSHPRVLTHPHLDRREAPRPHNPRQNTASSAGS